MAAILLLGFSSGVPLYLTSRTLQAWMTVAGVDLATIGFFSLAGLPYSLKFLWSPLVDRFSPPFLGRRKGWLIATQCALALAIAAMAMGSPPGALRFLMINALVIAFLSATQDITVDAYTADVLKPDELGPGSSIKVLGYRAAMLLTGAGALVMADFASWPAVYFTLGMLMFVILGLSLLVPEPVLPERPPSTLHEAVRQPFVDFFKRTGTSHGVWVLIFIVVYRAGDLMINNMTTSFLLKTGFTQTDIGLIQGGLGIFATIAGIVAGGAAMSRIGIHRSLWVFGFLQAASNLMYVMLAVAGQNRRLMLATITVENFCYGLINAALVGFLMSLCSPRFSATQYALLSSVLAAGRDVVASPSGRIAEVTGWPVFFLLTVLAAIPGMLMLPLFAPWSPRGNGRHFCTPKA